MAPRAKKTPSARQRKSVTPTDDAGDAAVKQIKIQWEKEPVRTQQLVDYLNGHEEYRIALFSDSTKEAKSQYCCKIINKSSASKSDVYNIMKYSKAINNHIGNLKNKYQAFNCELGVIGSDLCYDDVETSSHLWNLIKKLKEIPHINVMVKSSNPGTQHGEDTARFFSTSGKYGEEVVPPTPLAEHLGVPSQPVALNSTAMLVPSPIPPPPSSGSLPLPSFAHPPLPTACGSSSETSSLMDPDFVGTGKEDDTLEPLTPEAYRSGGWGCRFKT
ncbi:hypothetical protein SERLA73DRAFT_150292 [Serpula lacrymans var. lacrymans S7.3]|uniref:Uncharacterized protein n=1 Tax=Serpula lacrymans var. lacrymans (strain S7.3) TaxID=936435 RepID=F8PLX8_SERL3|nr:hypothetical protein SERLA73DRAFT_150292 [Serpula lacrymans var. lacrymans S7.3]